jgi:hypothetical protein
MPGGKMRQALFFLTTSLALLCSAPAARGQVSFPGVGVGVLPGDNQSIGYGVSEVGSVVGHSRGEVMPPRAFYWNRATRTMYQLTPSGATGTAFAIAGGSGTSEYAVGSQKVSVDGASRAVIWIAPPTSGPTYLDGNGSLALGVNKKGVAVGWRVGIPTIWSPTANNTYVRTSIALLANHASGLAEDINDNGIVVGENYAAVTFQRHAFLRLLNGTVIQLAPMQTDIESRANAVSNIFSSGGLRFVYVAGSSISAGGVERGVRWKVNVDTGAVAGRMVLNMQFAAGVNNAGNVAGARLSQIQQIATLWRAGTYMTLEPPQGGGNTASLFMTRTGAPRAFVVGSTIMKRRQGVLAQAVLWDVN